MTRTIQKLTRIVIQLSPATYKCHTVSEDQAVLSETFSHNRQFPFTIQLNDPSTFDGHLSCIQGACIPSFYPYNSSPDSAVRTSVYVWQSFCKFFTFDMQKLAPKNKIEGTKLHINWDAQFRSWHILWLVKKNTHVNWHFKNWNDTCYQARKYHKLQLKYPENITHNNRRTSYTHLRTWVEPCFSNFLCNREGSTIETVIKEMMEAKYKADKTIVLGFLRMYFHVCFCTGMWIHKLPKQISKSDALAS